MKKLVKVLFGRMTIVGLLIIVQILLFAAIYTVFASYSVELQFVTLLLTLIVLVDIINRDMLPDGKLPWIITVMMVPIAGVLLYGLMSRNYISKKQLRLLKSIGESSRNLIDNNKDEHLQFATVGNQYYTQSQYLYNTSRAMLHGNTTTNYFATGEEWWQDLLQELQKAEKYIFMEYFIIERGLMWDSILKILQEKVKQGVEVRVMYDDLGSVSKLPSNYHKVLTALGIDCVVFNKLTPIVTVVHNNRDHRKITVIDGKVGYVGGTNLADEYINHTSPYGYWKDTVIKLEGEGVKNLVLMFSQLYCLASGTILDYNKYIPESYPQLQDVGYVAAFGDGPKPYYEELVAQQTYINIINQAVNYVYITTPYLIPDNALKSALRSASQRGVDVRIYTPGIPDKKLIYWITQNNYTTLLNAGVKIYQYDSGFLHAKSIIADDIVAVVGTINLDYRSLLHHYECGVWMYKTTAIQQIHDDIVDMQHYCTNITKCPLNAFKRAICRIINIYAPLL